MQLLQQVCPWQEFWWDRVWSDIVDEVVAKFDGKQPLNSLEAAVLTLVSLPSFNRLAASSQEIFIEAALHAEVYQKLLHEKLGSEYSTERFYGLLGSNLPKLLKRLIAMDSVIIDFYRANVMDRSKVNDPSEAEYYTSSLKSEFFVMDETFALTPHPKMIELFKQRARQTGTIEDSWGRRANRGCPFLRTDNQDKFISFTINELVSQHRKYSHDS